MLENRTLRNVLPNWSCALFGVLVVFFFFPAIFQGKVIAPLDILAHLMRPWSDAAGGFGVHNAMVYDAVSQYLPYDWTVFQSVRQDGFVGWNPLVYGGFAIGENTMQCPGDWHHLLYRALDFWTAWNLGIVLQFALAGIGMLVFLGAEGLSPAAALLGAVCFSFHSQHTTWIYHRWVLGASCWFPWMAWAIRRARRKGRRFDLVSGAFTAMALRGGSLQTCLFVALLCAALFAADAHDCLRCESRETRGSGLGMLFAFWVWVVAIATLLSMNVMLDTIPPCLAGSRPLADVSFVQCLKRLPHFGTLLAPSLFGSPQTMDVGKAFGSDIFVTKFFGAPAFILALFAMFRKKAPLAAKLAVAFNLFVILTPLVKWFYERSTVVFAFGGAWLAAWAIDNAAEAIPERAWKWISRIGAFAVAGWAAAGAAVAAMSPRILPAVHKYVEGSIQGAKASRHDWMLARADAFVAEFPPWSFSHAVPLLLAAAGLYAAWRASGSTANRRASTAWTLALALCTFLELFTWSRSWITFSEKPDTAATRTLYPVQDWAAGMRAEMADGGLLYIHDRSSDFDYLQINSTIGIDIPCFQGYETIRPATMADPAGKDFSPEDFASRGISHVLVRPGLEEPEALKAWREVINDGKIHLYRNPAFQSRFVATLEDGGRAPLQAAHRTPNTMRFAMPAGAVAIDIAQPWHRKWTATLEDSSGQAPARIEKTAIGAMRIVLERPASGNSILLVRFK